MLLPGRCTARGTGTAPSTLAATAAGGCPAPAGAGTAPFVSVTAGAPRRRLLARAAGAAGPS